MNSSYYILIKEEKKCLPRLCKYIIMESKYKRRISDLKKKE
jgi:hypothetical protein